SRAVAMIQETDSMDQIITKGPGISRKTLMWLAAAGVLAVAVGLLWPAVQRWARAEQSVDFSRLQIATVVRGDLERDVAAQGRVVAANHPKQYSRRPGIISLAAKPGQRVKAGQVLATLASRDLGTSVKQERSGL